MRNSVHSEGGPTDWRDLPAMLLETWTVEVRDCPGGNPHDPSHWERWTERRWRYVTGRGDEVVLGCAARRVADRCDLVLAAS